MHVRIETFTPDGAWLVIFVRESEAALSKICFVVPASDLPTIAERKQDRYVVNVDPQAPGLLTPYGVAVDELADHFENLLR